MVFVSSPSNISAEYKMCVRVFSQEIQNNIGH